MTEVLHTPTEWQMILRPDGLIRDPDGWRRENSPDFGQPITREEFEWRYLQCTIQDTSQRLTEQELAEIHDILAQANASMGPELLPYLKRAVAAAQVDHLIKKTHRLAGIPEPE